MYSRYNNNTIIRSDEGKRVYKSRIMPNIPLNPDDIYVMTEYGDRLDLLAFQYYKNATLWWIIARANNIHDTSLALKEGIILRIPRNYLQILKKFNT